MDDLRWAIMGTGLIAAKLGRAIDRVAGNRVSHIASRDADRARAFAREHGYADARGVSYDELLGADVDAVYLTLPNHLHVAWSIRLLEAGKHVLCEKPLTPWRAEAERAFEAAERAGRVLVEGFLWPHHEMTRRMIEIARGGASGPIGPLRMVRADRGHRLADGPTVNTRWSHEMWGGSLMDLGCYPIGLIRTLAGAEPTRVSAAAHVAAPLAGEAEGVDTEMAYQLTMSNGVLAQGACSMERSELGAMVRLIGDWGMAWTGWAYRPDPERAVLHLIRNDQHPDGPGEQEIVVEGGGDVEENQVADFAAAARGARDPLPDAAWSIAQAGAIEALLAGAGVLFGRG